MSLQQLCPFSLFILGNIRANLIEFYKLAKSTQASIETAYGKHLGLCKPSNISVTWSRVPLVAGFFSAIYGSETSFGTNHPVRHLSATVIHFISRFYWKSFGATTKGLSSCRYLENEVHSWWCQHFSARTTIVLSGSLTANECFVEEMQKDYGNKERAVRKTCFIIIWVG